MNKLIKIEWLKIRKYKAFWWVLAIVALSYPGVNYIFHNVFDNVVTREGNAAKLAQMIIGNPFGFPEAWHTVAYFSSFFVFIPAVLVIMLITNEYSYKTHRQNVIDGWSRNQFMTSKMTDLLIISLLITVLYIIVCLVTGYTNQDANSGNPSGMSYYIGLFALQTFAQLSIAFLIGFLLRKAFIALGVFIFYFLIFEPTLVGLAKWKANDIGEFLPLEISDRLIPFPAFLKNFDKSAYDKALATINIHILYTVLLTALIWWICFRINNRRDL